MFAIPGCPAAGVLCNSLTAFRLISESSFRYVFLRKRWSGSRVQGSSVSTTLLRSFLCDSRLVMVLDDPGICSRV